MKPYSVDFQEKIVNAYERGNSSIRKVATRFEVSKALVQRLLKQKHTQGHLRARPQGGSMKSELHGCSVQLAQMVEKHPDATLAEYCEYWGETQNQWLSPSTMCRALQREQLTLKKRRGAAVSVQQLDSKP